MKHVMRRVQALLAVGLAALALTLLVGTPAYADDGSSVVIGPTAVNWVLVVQVLVIPVVLPGLVGIVTRWQVVGDLPTLGKRAILAGLALVSQILTEMLQSAQLDRPYDLWLALFLGGVAYLIAEGTYQKFYKAPVEKTVPAEPLPVVIESTSGAGVNKSKIAPDLVATIEQAQPKTLATIIGGKQ